MRAIVIPLILILSLSMVFAAEQDPFVQNGRIVATIVVGDEAPSTDVILGAQIASYLQTFADETTTGIAKTSSEVTGREDVLLLLGTPTNNPLVDEALDGDSPRGAYLSLDGDVMIVSGKTQSDLNRAVELFRQGVRDSGSLETTPRESIPELPEMPEIEEDVDVPLVEDPEIDEDIRRAVQSTCTPTAYCSKGAVVQRFADCSTERIEYCPNGCADGVCQKSTSRKFFSQLVDLIIFWR